MSLQLEPEEYKYELDLIGQVVELLRAIRLGAIVNDLEHVSAVGHIFEPTAYRDTMDARHANQQIAQALLTARTYLADRVPGLAGLNHDPEVKYVEGLDDAPGANQSVVGLSGDHIVIMRPRTRLTRDSALNLAAYIVMMSGGLEALEPVLKKIEGVAD